MKKVVIKVPAKLIISGEHSVLYTGKAITCAIDRYMVLRMKPIRRNVIKIKGNGFRIKYKLKNFLDKCFDNRLELEVIRSFFAKTSTKPSGISILIKSKIPVNCGMGSSAAIISGMLFGLNELYETNISRDDLISMATNLENICHGKSSGIDVISVIYGGVLSFNNGKYEKIPHSFNEIWYVNTGSADFSTKDVVKMIADNSWQISNDFWSECGDITNSMEINIIDGRRNEYLIMKNQQMLEKLGVVSKKAHELIRNIASYNIYAKVCGAGTISELDKNGGCGVVAVFQKLSRTQIKILKKLCSKYSWKPKKVNIANAGIEVDVF